MLTVIIMVDTGLRCHHSLAGHNVEQSQWIHRAEKVQSTLHLRLGNNDELNSDNRCLVFSDGKRKR